MVKYALQENTYKEMYLINKFEKDIMENSMQNLGNNKRNTVENIVQTDNINNEAPKSTLENKIEKLVPPRKGQELNESDHMNIPEARILSIENETPQDKTLLNNDINIEKVNDTSKSKNAFSPTPQKSKGNSDAKKKTPEKIDKLKRSKKKPKVIKNPKLSSARITRTMAKNIEKAKEEVMVKSSDNATSVTSWKKKKKENPNDSPEEFFHGWKL